MPYIFPDYIVPPAGVTIPMLVQTDVKGGLLVLQRLADLDSIKVGSIKLGMIVSVVEEKGAMYECYDILIDYDDDYNEVYVPKFRPFYTPVDTSMGGDDNVATRYERPKKLINFSYIAEGAIVNIPIDMECKSFIITNVRVTEERLIVFKAFSLLSRKDIAPYVFDSSRRNYDSGMTRLYGGQNFQYRKFFTCVNQETAKANQTKFVFQCTSLEKGAYTTSKGLTWNDVVVELEYIPLEQ